MAKVFEDEFMDLQARMIGLCEELTEGRVDKIFVYCCIERRVNMFHAFFAKNGKALHAGDLKIPGSVQDAFLKLGMSDMREIEKLCERYGRPTPSEIKMSFDVKTRSLETQYRYEDYISGSKISNEDVIRAWMKEVESAYAADSGEVPEKAKKPGFKFPFFGKK